MESYSFDVSAQLLALSDAFLDSMHRDVDLPQDNWIRVVLLDPEWKRRRANRASLPAPITMRSDLLSYSGYAVPLIPALPVLVTWYLPWERWIPRRKPKHVIGLYLLYCAFGAWCFKMPWWFVALVAIWGIGVCFAAMYEYAEHKNG